jgi:hypothetical protein
MKSNDILFYCLLAWIAAVTLVVYSQVRTQLTTVGLGVMYLLNLGISHFLGGVIYLLPWYSTALIDNVERGFEATTYGLAAFTLGTAVITPLIVKVTGWPRMQAAKQTPEQRLAYAYLVTALSCYFVLIPILGRIPTLGAMLSSGWTLMVVGLCLLVWYSYQRGARRQMLFWLAATAFLPFTTVITQGFLGYGTAAAVVVLTFAAGFYRPRWQVAIAAVLCVYLGLSVYVTYMRDRNDIRETVWGGESFSRRLDKLTTTFSEAELFDIYSQEHLALIDIRLNQNYLVGAAVDYMANDRASFANGETIWQSILALIPRIIWPDKPFEAGGQGIVTKYTGIVFGENTSVGVGQVMEFYINFGYTGIVVGFLVMGIIIGMLDKFAATRLKEGDWQGFALWFLPGLGLLQVGGSLGEMTSTAGASFVAALIINRVMFGSLRGKVEKVPERTSQVAASTLPRHLLDNRQVGRRVDF